MIEQNKKSFQQSKVRLVMAAGRLKIIYLLSASTGEASSHVTSGIFFPVLTIIRANTDQNILPLRNCMSVTFNSFKELNNPLLNQKTICCDHQQLVQGYRYTGVCHLFRKYRDYIEL